MVTTAPRFGPGVKSMPRITGTKMSVRITVSLIEPSAASWVSTDRVLPFEGVALDQQHLARAGRHPAADLPAASASARCQGLI